MASTKPLPRLGGNGIIDLHVHIGPEFIRRRYNAATLAEEARREGIGVVMKNHFQPTTGWISTVRAPDDAVPLIGSVALNFACGGFDTHGIRSALSGLKTDLAASAPDAARFVVWMPTVSAEAHLNLFNRRDIDLNWGVDKEYTELIPEGQGLRLMRTDGALNPGALRVFQVIADRDLVLATGHLDRTETGILVENAHAAGVRRMVLTHPLWHGIQFDPATLAQLFQRYQAYSELCFTNLDVNGIDHLTIDQYVEVIRTVGPEGVVLSSDCGQTFTPSVADCARIFFSMLAEKGVTEDEIIQMAIINPRRLLFAPRHSFSAPGTGG
ncbi:MAG: DUF6282 family protein [Parvibaculaceae bacterium]